MLNLPKGIIHVLRYFEESFSERIWQWARVLLIGAILAPGERTVTAILRVMGLQNEKQFQNYHRVLNRARWSSRALSRILLCLLVHLFVPKDAPIVVGIDETIARRRGARIAARGIYRDPVRSSKEFFVKTSGLRWISMMLLAPIPWANRVWALPFFTVLAPSERYHQQHRQRHKKLTDWGRQMMLQLRRWLPDRHLVVVADNSYAVLDLLAAVSRLRQPITVITRLRLDAALYEPTPVRQPGTNGRPRKKGERQSTLACRVADPATRWQPLSVCWYGKQQRVIEVATATAVWFHNGLPPVAIRWVLVRDPQGQFDPQALLCTDQQAEAAQIIEWFVLRWQMEVTFHEVRAHLGVETQRQWSDLAIVRTTPALLALFSLVTIFAHQLLQGQSLPTRQAAWYSKTLPTFSDTLALVRQHLWPVTLSYLSPATPDSVEIPRALFERFIQTLAFAA
ncbi:MAG TPA: transposase [Ktedonobacteraceae bacterium]|nr:transposase [Ktedonobacteraceae bacterium]